MALMIGRRAGQQVRIGETTITVTGIDERSVSVSVRPGGPYTFTTPFRRLVLRSERAEVQARPHPHPAHAGAAQLRITAPREVEIVRIERSRGSMNVERMFRANSRRLVGYVQSRVGDVSLATVEDACQHAWIAYLRNEQSEEERAAYAFLVKSAVREAWKLGRRERRTADEIPVDVPAGGDTEATVIARERLALEEASIRQRRLLWLRAAGFSYAEMETLTGQTRRTIDRQLQRGRKKVV